MLAYDLSKPANPRDGATVAVLMHGRGSHRGDMQALRSQLPPDWILLTPQAPHPGHPWGYGPGWAWYRYLSEDLVEEPGLLESLNALGAFVDQLPEIVRVRPGRVLLGGFSQGGTMSLAYALTRPGNVHAVLNFSGFLADVPSLEAAMHETIETPIFWGHGTRDPSVAHALADRGRKRLAAAGAPLVSRDYEIGHWIAPEEIADAVAFVEELGVEAA